jgi:D-glycero-alpha-D-manno-heptose-7-phosphate kinase
MRIGLTAEIKLSRTPDGTQDYYPAVFGGVNQIEYGVGGESRTSINVNTEQLESYLLLCDSRRSRNSARNNWTIFKTAVERSARADRYLSEIGRIAREVAVALESGALEKIGPLISDEWDARCRLCPSVATPEISEILRIARRNGGLGGKACGAGGGGYVLVTIEPQSRNRVVQALRAHGYTARSIEIDTRGVRLKSRGMGDVK